MDAHRYSDRVRQEKSKTAEERKESSDNPRQTARPLQTKLIVAPKETRTFLQQALMISSNPPPSRCTASSHCGSHNATHNCENLRGTTQSPNRRERKGASVLQRTVRLSDSRRFPQILTTFPALVSLELLSLRPLSTSNRPPTGGTSWRVRRRVHV